MRTTSGLPLVLLFAMVAVGDADAGVRFDTRLNQSGVARDADLGEAGAAGAVVRAKGGTWTLTGDGARPTLLRADSGGKVELSVAVGPAGTAGGGLVRGRREDVVALVGREDAVSGNELVFVGPEGRVLRRRPTAVARLEGRLSGGAILASTRGELGRGHLVRLLPDGRMHPAWRRFAFGTSYVNAASPAPGGGAVVTFAGGTLVRLRADGTVAWRRRALGEAVPAVDRRGGVLVLRAVDGARVSRFGPGGRRDRRFGDDGTLRLARPVLGDSQDDERTARVLVDAGRGRWLAGFGDDVLTLSGFTASGRRVRGRPYSYLPNDDAVGTDLVLDARRTPRGIVLAGETFFGGDDREDIAPPPLRLTARVRVAG